MSRWQSEPIFVSGYFQTDAPEAAPQAVMNADRFFFIIGPLRTGSSLMARCIDDHPGSICLCESEINRNSAPLLLRQTVRIHAGQSAHKRSLPMIYVPGCADDDRTHSDIVNRKS